MMKMRQKLSDSTRWVIKIGSALLTNDGQGLDNQAIADWAEQIAELRKKYNTDGASKTLFEKIKKEMAVWFVKHIKDKDHFIASGDL